MFYRICRTMRSAWENKTNFKSLRTAYGSLYNLIETGVDSTDLYLFAQKNPKFFEITKNADGEDELTEINGDPVFQRICDASGMFVKENKVFRVLREYLISAPLAYAEDLKNLSYTQISAKQLDLSVFKVSSLSGNTEGSKEKVGEYDENTALKDEKWCANDRKVVVLLTVRRDWLQDAIVSESYARFRVLGKRKYGCVWARYKTRLTATNVWFNYGVYQKNADGVEVMIPLHYPAGTQGKDFNVESLEIFVAPESVISDGLIPPITNGKVAPAFLQNYYCKVTSRGVNGRYAELPKAKQNLNE